MKRYVIKKWVEPYRLLETVKKFYEYKDFTFNGQNKIAQKQEFLDELEKDKNNIGLYMKNVNKFYLFSRSEEFDIMSELTKVFDFQNDDIEQSSNLDEMFVKIDLGKAEAELIIP